MTISPATGVPVESKENDYGTQKRSPVSSRERAYGTSTNGSKGKEFAKALDRLNLQKPNRFLARLTETLRQAKIYGVRPERSFETAAIKFVRENQHKRSLDRDICLIKQLMPFIGSLPLQRIHRGTLEPWVDHKRQEGRAPGTINHGLKVVRRILNLAEYEWMDEHGMTWLDRAPRIKLLPDTNKRQPYPLNWGRAAATVLGPATASRRDGIVRSQHRLPRCRNL